jgi:hypothetical protein
MSGVIFFTIFIVVYTITVVTLFLSREDEMGRAVTLFLLHTPIAEYVMYSQRMELIRDAKTTINPLRRTCKMMLFQTYFSMCGRLMISSLGSSEATVVTIIAMAIIQGLIRVTTLWRDRMLTKFTNKNMYVRLCDVNDMYNVMHANFTTCSVFVFILSEQVSAQEREASAEEALRPTGRKRAREAGRKKRADRHSPSPPPPPPPPHPTRQFSILASAIIYVMFSEHRMVFNFGYPNCCEDIDNGELFLNKMYEFVCEIMVGSITILWLMRHKLNFEMLMVTDHFSLFLGHLFATVTGTLTAMITFRTVPNGLYCSSNAPCDCPAYFFPLYHEYCLVDEITTLDELEEQKRLEAEEGMDLDTESKGSLSNLNNL